MVSSLILGTFIIILNFVTCGRVQTDWYDDLMNKQFMVLFGMKTNDVEGFRRARSIN